MQLFELFGSIMVDNKKANESIHKTDSLVSKLSNELGKGIKTAVKWGVVIGAGAIAGGSALFGMAQKTADTGDRIDKLSQKIGLSRQGFQEWEYVLSQNGVEIESLQGGMKKLVKSIDDAKSGSEGAIEAFERVGISVDDIKNANPEKAFEMIVASLQKMPEGAEKAALANELLGRSGSELMPLLNGSAESVEELKKKAHELGIVISDDAVDASAKFTDNMDNLKRSFGAIVTKIGVAVMPMMKQFADWVIAHMPQIQAIMEIVFNAIKMGVQLVADVFKNYLMPVFLTVKDWIVANWPTIKQVVEEVFEGIKDALNIFVEAFKFIWDAFGEHIKKYIEITFNHIKEMIQSVINVIRGIIDTITALIKGDWEGVWNGIKKIAEGIWEAIKTSINTALDTIKLIIKSAWNLIKTITSAVWNEIKNLISVVWTAINSGVSSAVNSLKNTVSSVFNSLKNTVSSIWNSIKNAIMTSIRDAKDGVSRVIDGIKGLFNFKWKWPKIPLPHFSFSGSLNPLSGDFPPKIGVEWYAKGGIFDKPTIFNTPYGLKGVGEKGPEAVTPISKLQEMIDWNSGINPTQMNSIIELLKVIAGKSSEIIINGKVLAKEVTPDINKQLELINQRG